MKDKEEPEERILTEEAYKEIQERFKQILERNDNSFNPFSQIEVHINNKTNK